MVIRIDKEFQNLILPLREEERSILEQSILQEGVRDDLVVWENGATHILLDGHHRWALIQKHKIRDYRVSGLHLGSRDEAINWIIRNQLGRRNCTREQIAYLRGVQYRNHKKAHGGARKSNGKSCHLTTADTLARAHGVSARTIRNDEQFATAVDAIAQVYRSAKDRKEARHKILNKEADLSQGDVLKLAQLPAEHIKEVLSGRKKIWQVQLEIEQQRKKRKKKHIQIVLPDELQMLHGDCLQLLPQIAENSIDAALIDPLYGVPKGKEQNSFDPAHIEKFNLVKKAHWVGNRSPALKAGLYDQSYEGGKRYQRACEKWGRELLRVMKPGGHILCFCSPQMYPRMVCGLEDAGWDRRNALVWVFGTGFPTSNSISQRIDKLLGKKGRVVCENPNRQNRVNWDSHDKNIVAPQSPEAEQWEGYYDNLKSSCELIFLGRKPLSEKTLAENVLKWDTGALNIDACRIPGDRNGSSMARLPSNVVLSPESAQVIDEQAGHSVSQYFYYAKPSGKEKEWGCEDTGNPHPTVKPLALCRHLLDLIAPPGSTVIDIFAGSGTTGMACALNNLRFIGMEKEEAYWQTAKNRIMAAYEESRKNAGNG